MFTLAIETSSKSVSVALLDGATTVLQLDSGQNVAGDNLGVANRKLTADAQRLQAGATDQLPPGFVRKRSKGGSKTSRVFPPGASVLLAPMIQSLFEQTNHSINDVKLIATAIGPGLFTGLRVGVVTAKTLAYAVGAEIIGINTLEAIATQTSEWVSSGASVENVDVGRICPIVNAQRQQVFAGYFTMDDRCFVKEINASRIVDREQWISEIRPGDILTGSGLHPILESVREQQPTAIIAPENCWSCTAETIGRMAARKFDDGTRDSLWDLEPLYFRPSAAEEVRAAKLDQDPSSTS